MTHLKGDIENRVLRLPKPSSLADALQPVFEAVSNGAHAIVDRFGDGAAKKGRINVTFSEIKSSAKYRVIISDNGVGLEPERFDAFCTTDTKFKLERGGKGVGRLLWLDAFRNITVTSIYADDAGLRKRKFEFSLDAEEPIYNESDQPLDAIADLGTTIEMVGIRPNSYAEKMPTRFSDISKHFGSHFLADFLLGGSPEIVVVHEGDSSTFPADIEQLLLEKRESVEFETEDFGSLNIDAYIMKRAASSDLDGNHQLHLVASGRTVETRKIDGLIGVKKLGHDGSGVFHGCVSGEFLDQRVNQERTQFNFSEQTAEQITKLCAEQTKNKILGKEATEYEETRLEALEGFVDLYPSFGFESSKTLLDKTPISAASHEAFASALIKHKIRADRKRREVVQSVVDRLVEGEDIAPSLSAEVSAAARAALEDENRQLMEYVVRRKFVIEILDALLGKVRLLNGKYDTHLEETFHQLLCPMKIVGDDPYKTEPTSHDLWLLDERLAPAIYFASDARMDEFLEDGSADRLDLLVWDKIHGLGLGAGDKLDRVLLVEFKKPERGSYKGNYVLGRQMNRYMKRLVDRKVRSHTGELVELSKDVVFHCYVVADLVGDLEVDTSSWMDAPSGRGKFQFLQGEFRGIMEIIEWRELVRDAKVRNKNFLEAARLAFTAKGEPVFKKSNSDSAVQDSHAE